MKKPPKMNGNGRYIRYNPNNTEDKPAKKRKSCSTFTSAVFIFIYDPPGKEKASDEVAATGCNFLFNTRELPPRSGLTLCVYLGTIIQYFNMKVNLFFKINKKRRMPL